MAKKVHRYTGILNRPMPKPEPINALAPNSPINREKLLHEYQCRLDALMLDCKLDPDDPDRLGSMALVLAERHVPGFSFETSEKSAARAEGWRRYFAILSEMKKLIRDGMSQRSAADNVSKRMNRRRSGSKKLTAGAVDKLYRRYKSADDE